jgi:hypothetical protein
MIQFYPKELFKQIEIEDGLQLNYAISNYGRLISYKDKFENGRIVKGSLIDGYRIFRYKLNIEGKLKNKHFFYYKLVAHYFLDKKEEQTNVLHLDRDRANDVHYNLKWVTKAEMLKFHSESPMVIEAKKKLVLSRVNSKVQKLTSTQVMRLKKMLLDPNRKTRMRIIAKQFGISEMQLYRIKSGENWGHIQV